MKCEGMGSEEAYEKMYTSQATAYDAATGQRPVLTHAQLDAFFQNLAQASPAEKDTAFFFRQITTSPNPDLKRYSYYKVSGPDIYRFLLGDHRLYEFLCRDSVFYENLRRPEAGIPLYFRLKPATFHLALDFLLQLEADGFDPAAVRVRYGYRHPQYNIEVGGALKSQHIYGTAIDLAIGDLNRDGAEDSLDKAIASERLEQLVGAKGGLGNYPGTQVLHIDTRGYRARWQSYTPGKERLQKKKWLP